ncbi:hypothetical protein Trydic_g19915 [Trypoxylus dichotomus]
MSSPDYARKLLLDPDSRQQMTAENENISCGELQLKGSYHLYQLSVIEIRTSKVVNTNVYTEDFSINCRSPYLLPQDNRGTLLSFVLRLGAVASMDWEPVPPIHTSLVLGCFLLSMSKLEFREPFGFCSCLLDGGRSPSNFNQPTASTEQRPLSLPASSGIWFLGGKEQMYFIRFALRSRNSPIRTPPTSGVTVSIVRSEN